FRDIVVLTRKNDQAIQVAQFLTENNIPIISSESLLVSQADEVKIIVFILKFLNSNNIESLAEAFYLLHRFQNREEEIHDWVYSMLVQCKDNTLNDWFVNQGYDLKIQKIKRLPLYEMVDVLVRELLKIEQTHAHLQFFMDF
ncbi:hypothetical protein RZS08_27115, partial [Arthrospira platensis SPKY1]|nr:hypothetical protein [Arthrospira platensis SPKY1]